MAQVLANYEEQLDNAQMPAGKKKVLTTALKLFASNGFHATTTEKIAKQAGVSEGTIYKYFASKQDLLTQLLQPILEDIKDNFFSDLDEQHDLRTMVDFIVDDRIQFIEANFDFIRVIFHGVLTGQLLDNQTLESFLTGNNGFLTRLQDMQKAFPQINQQLTSPQMAQIFVGPIYAYVFQNKLLGLPASDNDVALIKKQILNNLTMK